MKILDVLSNQQKLKWIGPAKVYHFFLLEEMECEFLLCGIFVRKMLDSNYTYPGLEYFQQYDSKQNLIDIGQKLLKKWSFFYQKSISASTVWGVFLIAKSVSLLSWGGGADFPTPVILKMRSVIKQAI